MLRAVRRRTKRFIYVYRLAIDAMTRMGDDVTGRKWPSLLEDFQTGRSINGSPETSCINRKGFLMFLSYLPPLFMTLHIALCCLEGSTMSNLVHRRRRCARIVLHLILCLEGSTPEDGRFIYVYRLGEDGDLMKYDAVMLRFWTLRARSYKTRAEA